MSKNLIKKTSSQWIGKNINSAVARKYITAYLENAVESGIEESIKQVGAMIKGKTKPEDFFTKVATSMATGGFMKKFDKVVDNDLGKAIYGSISPKARKEIFGALDPKVAVKVIEELIKSNTGNIVSNGFEKVLGAATGKESDKAIVGATAKKITSGSDFAKFQKLLAEKAKKRK